VGDSLPRQTVLLRADDPADISVAGRLLREGKLVAVPTETVYGLAADATDPDAVAGIFTAKGRPRTHPLIVHVGSVEQLPEWASEVPSWVGPLVDVFWPGPLTLLLDRNPSRPDIVTGGLPTIGLRMPAHPALLQLLRAHRLAVAAPSANRYQKLSPTSAAQVMASLAGRIDAVLDGGPCAVGTESTILRVAADRAEILRAGPISAAMLQEHLPVPVHAPAEHAVSVPGNQRVHYQPDAPIQLVSTAELEMLLQHTPAETGCLFYTAELQGLGRGLSIRMPHEDRGYRRALYGALHQLDREGVSRILVELPPLDPEWLDIRDRLQRAAGPSSSPGPEEAAP
jgi:L-threonylcarbamoyladenylate synthase